MAMRRVLLTGGSGFIGRNLLASPLGANYEFLSPGHRELDLVDTDQVDAFFRANRVDAIVHAAGKPGHRNAPDHDALFYSNTRQYFNLARHAPEVERMIVIGSGASYGMEHYLPRMQEGYFGVHVPKDEHGFMLYVTGRDIARSANIVDLRVFGVFGPGEDYAIRFISNMMCKCVHGLPLTVKQDRRMDYLWVGDLAPVLDALLSGEPRHRAYNVTPDETVSLVDLAHRIRAVSGKDLEIRVGAPGQGREYSGDNARLRAECPAFIPTPWERSLPMLYRHYVEHSHEIRREALLHDK
jgi:GDP-L-fucose synthase